MNQLVPFHSGQAPVLIDAAGERARVRFIKLRVLFVENGPGVAEASGSSQGRRGPYPQPKI